MIKQMIEQNTAGNYMILKWQAINQHFIDQRETIKQMQERKKSFRMNYGPVKKLKFSK